MCILNNFKTVFYNVINLELKILRDLENYNYIII